MSKIIFVLTLALGCIAASAAQAQSDAQKKAALSSPYLPKARACMDNLAAAGKAAGFDTDRDGGNVAIEHPTNQKKLGEILADTFGCLDTAFEMKKKKVVREKTGTPSWIWYTAVSGLYIWCASDGKSDVDHIDRVGGYGPKKDCYGIILNCSIGDKVLTWYTPDS